METLKVCHHICPVDKGKHGQGWKAVFVRFLGGGKLGREID
jgi:hypothetical protein